MYGLIGKIIAIADATEQLSQILVDGVAGMPGCLSYVVANDVLDENAIWITEVWESKDLHAASLSLDSVQQAIAKGRPLISGFGERFETIPVGGKGL
jgi:quinol monooxygenase YgiN